MTAESMLAAARKYLGTVGRPNVLTRRYASRHGDVFLNAPWCDIAVTEYARESGNAAAVLPDGDRAFTVWHAEDGRDLGRWYPGTSDNIREHALPGAVIFFDWDGTDRIGAIDHVGIVEVNLGDGRVQTIEGNTGDACKRRVRSASVIAGFWNPPYDKTDAAAKPKPRSWTEELMKDLPLLRPGDDNYDVKSARGLLNARGYVPASAYAAVGLEAWLNRTKYDDELAELIRGYQRIRRLDDDALVGEQTWRALNRVGT